MNKEEIKNAIEAIKANYPPESYTELRKGLDLAIQALEKQIAKRPIANDNGNYAEYFESWLECQDCGEAIPEYTAENNTWCYCLGCGQKLDWEVEN